MTARSSLLVLLTMSVADPAVAIDAECAPEKELWGSKPADLRLLQSCKTIHGDVYIDAESPPFTAANLVKIDGKLAIRNPKIMPSFPSLKTVRVLEVTDSTATTLKHVKALTSVGRLIVSRNRHLLDLEGLEGITSLEDLLVSDNEKLASIAGLRGLQEVRGNLEISYNEALVSVTGLDRLVSVTGDLRIMFLRKVIEVNGLAALQSVGKLTIVELYALEDLSGLRNLKQVAEALVVARTNARSLTALSAVQRNEKINIEITGNNNLSWCHILLVVSGMTGVEQTTLKRRPPPSIRLSSELLDALIRTQGDFQQIEGCTEAPGNVTIEGSAVTSVSRLASLVKIHGTLKISKTSIQNIAGLSNVLHFGRDVVIEENSLLRTLLTISPGAALYGNLSLRGNTALRDPVAPTFSFECETPSQCAKSPETRTYIRDNGYLVSTQDLAPMGEPVRWVPVDSTEPQKGSRSFVDTWLATAACEEAGPEPPTEAPLLNLAPNGVATLMDCKLNWDLNVSTARLTFSKPPTKNRVKHRNSDKPKAKIKPIDEIVFLATIAQNGDLVLAGLNQKIEHRLSQVCEPKKRCRLRKPPTNPSTTAPESAYSPDEYVPRPTTTVDQRIQSCVASSTEQDLLRAMCENSRTLRLEPATCTLFLEELQTRKDESAAAACIKRTVAAQKLIDDLGRQMTGAAPVRPQSPPLASPSGSQTCPHSDSDTAARAIHDEKNRCVIKAVNEIQSGEIDDQYDTCMLGASGLNDRSLCMEAAGSAKRAPFEKCTHSCLVQSDRCALSQTLTLMACGKHQ